MGFSDAHLITRDLQAGDPNAVGELVRRYQTPVRTFLRKLTRGDEALADDLAQETFLRAWRKLETFRAEARFSSWLFGIAVNEFRGHLRRDRRHSQRGGRVARRPLQLRLPRRRVEGMGGEGARARWAGATHLPLLQQLPRGACGAQREAHAGAAEAAGPAGLNRRDLQRFPGWA